MEFKSFSWRFQKSKKDCLQLVLDDLYSDRNRIESNQEASGKMLSGVMTEYENEDRHFATVDEFIYEMDNDPDSDWRGPTFSGVYPETVRKVCLDWYDYTLKLIEIDERIEAIEFCMQHLDKLD